MKLAMNSTLLQSPFYYSPKSRLISPVSDVALTLVAPIIAYWSLSLFFHYLDISDWKWLEKYRIHVAREIQSKNLASRSEVVWAVISQQVIQTLLGCLFLDDKKAHDFQHSQQLQRLVASIEPICSSIFPYRLTPTTIWVIAYYAYWWFIPMFQFFCAMFIIDTWQYFFHRLMHVNKFLYKQFHSWHHRLYVPYAFGALYNHPLEGLVLDSIGALIAEWATSMTTRQAMLLFIFSTLKTVDDHCGYSLPYDPLQYLSGNNADYHDIHHQAIGIKSNFAQPFFVHWDTLLGTRMTRDEISRRRKQSNKTQ